MATQAQINANRKNAKKSTGPSTADGKETSSQNAFKHGLFVKMAVVHDESQEQYEAHREAMLAEWEPVGEMETIVTERLINLTWRLQRAQRMQNQAIDYLGLKLLGSCESDSFEDTYRDANDLPCSDEPPVSRDHLLLGRLAVNDWANYRVLDRMMMYERRIENSMFRTMRELERLQKARKDERTSWRGRPALESPGAGEKIQSRFGAETKLSQPHVARASCPCSQLLASSSSPEGVPKGERSRSSAGETQGRDGLATNGDRDEAATCHHNGDLVKRSQFVPELTNTMSFATRDYDAQSLSGQSGNKANQSQYEVCCEGAESKTKITERAGFEPAVPE